MMKCTFALLFLIQFAVLVYTSVTAPPIPGRLEAVSPIISCGTIPCGKSEEIELTLTNIGGEDCILDHISTSCGCVAGKVKNGTCVPASGRISIPVDVMARSGGRISVSVVVHYRNGQGLRLSTEVLLSGESDCRLITPEDDPNDVVPTPDPGFKGGNDE